MKESLRKRGMNYEALVRGKLDTALAFGQKLTLGAAEAEVIADASEQMLQDTTFIRSAPQGLKNKIKSVIKDFAKKVRAVFATLSGGHKESAALRELKNNMYHYVDDLQSKWDIAAVEMVNRQTEQGTQETEQGTQEAQQAVPVEALKPEKQFALKSTVEKRDDGLIAVHNLNEENLLVMLTEMEGIPAPSFAIVKARQGHTEFAEISVIVDSSSIDPQANSDNRVYGNDAWTQRVPRAAYEVNTDVVQEQRTHAEEILAPFSKNLAASAGSFYNDVENNQATRDPKKTLMARARANVGLMAEYLLEHGKTFDYKPNGGSRNNVEIFEKVKPDKEIYLEWVQEKLNRMLGKKTIAGTSADFTAENAVQLMRQGKESNGQTEYIAKNMQFNAAKRYRSLDEVRADAERLRMLPDEERNEFIFQMEDELEGILDALARKGEKSTLPLLSGVPDTRTIFKAQEILERAGREELSAQETVALFEQNGFESVNADDVERGLDLVKRIQEYPTGYFEAKPMRVVSFDEIRMLIVPDSISEELNEAIEEKGIPYTVYEEGNNTDRIAKMNSVEGVQFALRDTENMSWEEQVNRVFSNKMSRIATLSVNKSNAIIESIGADNLPIGMDIGDFRKVTRSANGSRSAHALSKNIMLALPDALQNPVAVFDNPTRNSIYVVTDLHDSDGNPVVAIIKKNQRDNVGTPMHKLASAYGMKNVLQYMQEHIPDGSNFLVDNKKAFSSMAGAQYIMTEADFQALEKRYNRILPSDGELVNSERQFARRDEPSTADVRRIVGGMQITDRMNDTEKDMLTRYQSHLTEMEKLIEQIEEQKRIIDSDEATDDEKMAAKARMNVYDKQRARHNGYLRMAEGSEGFARLMATSRSLVSALNSDGLENVAEKLEQQIGDIERQHEQKKCACRLTDVQALV